MNALFSKLFSGNRKPVLSKVEASETSPDLCRRIRNRKLVVALAVAFALSGLLLPPAGGKVARLGFLENSTASSSAVLVDTFRQDLRKLGWIEGKNITIEYRFAEQNPERLPEFAADLVRLKLIPRGCRFSCQSGARRQCNRFLEFRTELNTKRLEILKDAVPKSPVASAVAGSQNTNPLKAVRAAAPGLS